MPLPRLDYQQPDYLGQISQGVDAATQLAHGNMPAPEFIQRFAKHGLSNKMSPEEAAAWAKLVHAGHVADPTSGGQQLTGGNVTFSGPSLQAPMGQVNAPSPMPAAPPSGGGFTGPREFSDTETVTAPRQAQPDLSALNPEPDEPDLPPIRNRDVPLLMQAASGAQKHNPMDTYMKLYALGLRGQELQEKYREFEGMAPVRQSMINQRDASISNMPFKNQMTYGNLGQRIRSNDIGQGNLDERQNMDYLRETKETAMIIPALKGVLNTLRTNPGVAPGTMDYAARKASRIMGGLPFVGNMLKEGIETVADTALSPEQRQIRSQIALAVQPYRKLNVGTQITPGEFQLIDMITGQSLRVEDQVAALLALQMSMEGRHNRAKAASPAAAARIPDLVPQQMLPPIPQAYPTDSNQTPPNQIGAPTEEGDDLSNLTGRPYGP